MRLRRTKKRGGFTYSYPTEMIKEYKRLPNIYKLRWLEEASRFSYKAIPKKNKVIWEMFRRGEI